MWKLWSGEMECGIRNFFDLFWSGDDFWSIMAKNPWAKMGVNLQILSVLLDLACWVFCCFLWCLWMGPSWVLLVVLRFLLIFPVSVVACDRSCLLLLLGDWLRTVWEVSQSWIFKSRWNIVLQFSWSSLVWLWLGSIVPRFSELWWNFDSSEVKIRIRISSIFFWSGF